MLGVFTLLLTAFAMAGDGAPPFTVALDPGHGGSNLGAVISGGTLVEKRLTLELARRVRERLAPRPDIRVVLCRSQDVLVPLRARVRCGNEAGARLFLSLHFNASPEGPSRGTQRGFELYVLPAADVEDEAALAAMESQDDAQAALVSHRVRATAAESLAAARRIEWRLGDALGVERARGIKQKGAALDVLQGVGMPAVLVEVGFIDHPDEGPELGAPAGLDVVATALARAITDVAARERRGRKDPSITATRAREKVRRAERAPTTPKRAP